MLNDKFHTPTSMVIVKMHEILHGSNTVFYILYFRHVLEDEGKGPMAYSAACYLRRLLKNTLAATWC